jgi:hypothetical protein
MSVFKKQGVYLIYSSEEPLPSMNWTRANGNYRYGWSMDSKRREWR